MYRSDHKAYSQLNTLALHTHPLFLGSPSYQIGYKSVLSRSIECDILAADAHRLQEDSSQHVRPASGDSSTTQAEAMAGHHAPDLHPSPVRGYDGVAAPARDCSPSEPGAQPRCPGAMR